MHEPQSQYWLTAAEFGFLGIEALAFLFYSLWQASRRLLSMKPIAFGVLLTFFLGNLTDSMFWVSSTGYIFVLFMAMCLGEQIEMRALLSESFKALVNKIGAINISTIPLQKI